MRTPYTSKMCSVLTSFPDEGLYPLPARVISQADLYCNTPDVNIYMSVVGCNQPYHFLYFALKHLDFLYIPHVYHCVFFPLYSPDLYKPSPDLLFASFLVLQNSFPLGSHCTSPFIRMQSLHILTLSLLGIF